MDSSSTRNYFTPVQSTEESCMKDYTEETYVKDYTEAEAEECLKVKRFIIV